VKTLLANYAMWPLAHIINFKFIPSKQRILYINCVQVRIAAELQRLCVGLSPTILFTESLLSLKRVLCLFVGYLECLSVQHVVQSVNSFCWNCPRTARTGRLHSSSRLLLCGLLMQHLCLSYGYVLSVKLFGCLAVVCLLHDFISLALLYDFDAFGIHDTISIQQTRTVHNVQVLGGYYAKTKLHA